MDDFWGPEQRRERRKRAISQLTPQAIIDRLVRVLYMTVARVVGHNRLFNVIGERGRNVVLGGMGREVSRYEVLTVREYRELLGVQ